MLQGAFGADAFTPPEGTYIGWLDLTHVDHTPHESVADFLLHEAHIAVTDGAKCGEVGVGHVRIILASTTPILRDVLARLIDHTSR
jgi:cystathionine beta-lyase